MTQGMTFTALLGAAFLESGPFRLVLGSRHGLRTTKSHGSAPLPLLVAPAESFLLLLSKHSLGYRASQDLK